MLYGILLQENSVKSVLVALVAHSRSPNILSVFVMQLFTSGLGEEPGWRGFLLPRLQARYEGDKFVWVLGLLLAI